jgi:hypothetical protein
MAEEVPESRGRVAVEPFIAPVDTDSLLSSDMPPLNSLLASLHQIKAQQANQVRVSRASILRAARVMFQPAWSRLRSGSNLNRCMLEGVDQIFSSDWRRSAQPSPAVICRMDAMLLTKAVESLHACIGGSGRDATLIVPVQYATLRHPEMRAEYRLLFERIPEAYSRLIYVEVQLGDVDELPLDLHHTLLNSKAFLPRIWLHWPVAESGPMGRMTDCIQGMMLDLHGLEDQKHILSQRLPLLVETATRAGLLTCATGVNSMGLAEGARQAGFDFIVGTAIHGIQDEPRMAKSPALFG